MVIFSIYWIFHKKKDFQNLWRITCIRVFLNIYNNLYEEKVTGEIFSFIERKERVDEKDARCTRFLGKKKEQEGNIIIFCLFIEKNILEGYKNDVWFIKEFMNNAEN